MADKPTLIFVHGAFHGPDLFRGLSQELRRAGYNCVDDLHLPGVNGSPETTLADDVKAVREVILRTVDEQHDSIVN